MAPLKAADHRPALQLDPTEPYAILVHMSSDELRTAALSLPREQRAKLAEELIHSLDENRGETDAAWAKEVARRAQEIADGTVHAVDWEVARERILRRLQERRDETSASSRD